MDRSCRPRLVLDACCAVIRTIPPPALTSCSTRAVAANAWHSPRRFDGVGWYTVCSIACTPISRIDLGVLVPSPYTSTRGVSPSATQATFPVHTWHAGLPAPGRHAVVAAAGVAAAARMAAAADRTATTRRSTGAPFLPEGGGAAQAG